MEDSKHFVNSRMKCWQSDEVVEHAFRFCNAIAQVCASVGSLAVALDVAVEFVVRKILSTAWRATALPVPKPKPCKREEPREEAKDGTEGGTVGTGGTVGWGVFTGNVVDGCFLERCFCLIFL